MTCMLTWIQRLDGGVQFVDEIPKSPTGKIQRMIIREWVKKQATRAKL
jgi:acyl-coenzyme A synthetase/AMP-(fatty) acid ligase